MDISFLADTSQDLVRHELYMTVIIIICNQIGYIFNAFHTRTEKRVEKCRVTHLQLIIKAD